jgi:hypothetical protein
LKGKSLPTETVWSLPLPDLILSSVSFFVSAEFLHKHQNFDDDVPHGVGLLLVLRIFQQDIFPQSKGAKDNLQKHILH